MAQRDMTKTPIQTVQTEIDSALSLALGVTVVCDMEGFARSFYQIGHIACGTRHGRYLRTRYAAKSGSTMARATTVASLVNGRVR